MTSLNNSVSSCRHCKYYTPVGQRGGNCQILDVLVKGGWKGCCLSSRAFAPSGEKVNSQFEKIIY